MNITRQHIVRIEVIENGYLVSWLYTYVYDNSAIQNTSNKQYHFTKLEDALSHAGKCLSATNDLQVETTST